MTDVGKGAVVRDRGETVHTRSLRPIICSSSRPAARLAFWRRHRAVFRSKTKR